MFQIGEARSDRSFTNRPSKYQNLQVFFEGIDKGKKQGQIALILRQLERRMGSISPDIQTRISQLSLEQLENLGEAMLDFTSEADLVAWLQAA